MLSLASWLVAGHLLTSPPHLIDFQLAPGSQAKPATPGIVSPGMGSDEPVETYAPPRYSIAHGFGNGVPLFFAVKQMVPSMFHVIYRTGVDQDQLTSWAGGRPWEQALWLALRAHGLRMAVVGRTVTISH